MPPTALAPWQRADAYATLDKRALLALPVAQLARASGCLVLVWVTNSRHVQDFVEKVRVRGVKQVTHTSTRQPEARASCATGSANRARLSSVAYAPARCQGPRAVGGMHPARGPRL